MLEKRNSILLNEILRRPRARPAQLPLGGGLHAECRRHRGCLQGSEQAGQEKLKKAIEIIDNRINGLRRHRADHPALSAPTGIEVQLLGVSTATTPRAAESAAGALDFP